MTIGSDDPSSLRKEKPKEEGLRRLTEPLAAVIRDRHAKAGAPIHEKLSNEVMRQHNVSISRERICGAMTARVFLPWDATEALVLTLNPAEDIEELKALWATVKLARDDYQRSLAKPGAVEVAGDGAPAAEHEAAGSPVGGMPTAGPSAVGMLPAPSAASTHTRLPSEPTAGTMVGPAPMSGDDLSNGMASAAADTTAATLAVTSAEPVAEEQAEEQQEQPVTAAPAAPPADPGEVPTRTRLPIGVHTVKRHPILSIIAAVLVLAAVIGGTWGIIWRNGDAGDDTSTSTSTTMSTETTIPAPPVTYKGTIVGTSDGVSIYPSADSNAGKQNGPLPGDRVDVVCWRHGRTPPPDPDVATSDVWDLIYYHGKLRFISHMYVDDSDEDGREPPPCP